MRNETLVAYVLSKLRQRDAAEKQANYCISGA